MLSGIIAQCGTHVSRARIVFPMVAWIATGKGSFGMNSFNLAHILHPIVLAFDDGQTKIYVFKLKTK